MTKWKIFFILTALWSGYSHLNGQSSLKSPISIRELHVGDTVPDIPLKGLTNYPAKNVWLHDFHDKLLILDFWATHCGACIEAIPHMDSMVNKNNGRLAIIMVTSDNTKTVQELLQKLAKYRGAVHEPMINGDTLFRKLFPYEYVPHEVWIKDGVVKFISRNPHELDDQNIDAAFKGEPVKRAEGDEDYIKDISNTPSSAIPLFVKGNGGNGERIQYYSVLSGFIENSVSTFLSRPIDKMSIFNLPVKELYQIAYADDNSIMPDNRTELRLKDSSMYTGGWNYLPDKGKLYSYDLRVPRPDTALLYRCMREDLARFFGLKVWIEKRMMKAWVLSAEDTSLISSRGGDSREHINDFDIHIENASVKAFLRCFWDFGFCYHCPYPLIDHTGFSGNIDVIIEADMHDPVKLDQALYKKYKMHLSLQEAEVNILVISDPVPEKSSSGN